MSRKRRTEASGALPDSLMSGQPWEPLSSISYFNPSSSASQGYPHSGSQQSSQDAHAYREPPRKQARTTAYGASNGNGHNRSGYAPNARLGSSQANPYILESEDEDDGSQEVQDSTQGSNDQEYAWGYYGVLPTKIVGVRYYNGVATVGEMVVLRREPNNAYDSRIHRIQSLSSRLY